MDTQPNEQTPRHYTIAAVYDDNTQRYCTSGAVANPTEAAALAMYEAQVDNKFPETITIYGIFEGEHDCKDIYVSQADERPKYVPSRAKARLPFTVVGEYGISHIDAQNARLAERACADENDNVAAVFSRHLDNVLDQADLAQAKVLATQWVKEHEAELVVLLASPVTASAQPGATL